jgi:hypothetical protein
MKSSARAVWTITLDPEERFDVTFTPDHYKAREVTFQVEFVKPGGENGLTVSGQKRKKDGTLMWPSASYHFANAHEIAKSALPVHVVQEAFRLRDAVDAFNAEHSRNRR